MDNKSSQSQPIENNATPTLVSPLKPKNSETNSLMIPTQRTYVPGRFSLAGSVGVSGGA